MEAAGMLNTPDLSMAAIERAAGMPRSTISWMADRLPGVTRHGRRGKVRRFSRVDACMIFCASRFADRGLQPGVAIDMAVAARHSFVEIVASEGRIPHYIIATLKPDASGHYPVVVTQDVNKLAELLVPDAGLDGIAVFDLTDFVKEFLWRLLKQAKEANDAGD